MGNEIVYIHQKRFFSLEEARKLLPVVRKITHETVELLDQKSTQIEFLKDKDKKKKIEKQMYQIFRKWHIKVRRLGCEPKGLWVVDFDFGEGLFCWKYDEKDILFYHGYYEGFEKRRPL